MTENNSSESDDGFRNKWESIVADSDISSIPVDYLKAVEIKMFDGSTEYFNIKDLLAKDLSIDEIETMMEEFINQFDDNIDSLDFHLNLEALADEVGEKTKRLLG